VANFAPRMGGPTAECFQLQGAPPWPLTRGSAPGPRWGLCPQTPVIGSRSALAMSHTRAFCPPHCFRPGDAPVSMHHFPVTRIEKRARQEGEITPAPLPFHLLYPLLHRTEHNNKWPSTSYRRNVYIRCYRLTGLVMTLIFDLWVWP